MYYDIHTDRQTDRHRTLLGTAPCTSKSSYSNTSWYTFHLTFFFLWYFLILVPFQLAKKNMDLASLKNELSQSEARLTEQVCTLFNLYLFSRSRRQVDFVFTPSSNIYVGVGHLEHCNFASVLCCKDHSFCLFEFPVLTEWKERGGNESVWKNQQSSIPAGGSTG